MNFTRFLANLAGALALAILGPAGEGLAQQKKPAVRLNYSGSVYAVTSVVALERGFFDEEGLIVNASPESSGAVAVQALVGGSTDFAAAANIRPVQMAAQDLPIRVIAVSSYGFAGHVIVPVKDKTTKTMADLKGKRIGVQVGSGTYTVWLRYLKTQGLSEKDFAIKSMESETIPAAFEAQALDGAVLWDPFATLIREKGLGRDVLGPKDLAEPVGSTYAFYLITSLNNIQKRPDVVQRFVNAWAKTLRFIQNNPDEMVEIMQAFFAREGKSLPPATVKKLMVTYRYDRVVVSPQDIQDTMESARILFEQKRLKKLPDLNAYVDNSFALKAVQALK